MSLWVTGSISSNVYHYLVGPFLFRHQYWESVPGRLRLCCQYLRQSFEPDVRLSRSGFPGGEMKFVTRYELSMFPVVEVW